MARAFGLLWLLLISLCILAVSQEEGVPERRMRRYDAENIMSRRCERFLYHSYSHAATVYSKRLHRNHTEALAIPGLFFGLAYLAVNNGNWFLNQCCNRSWLSSHLKPADPQKYFNSWEESPATACWLTVQHFAICCFSHLRSYATDPSTAASSKRLQAFAIQEVSKVHAPHLTGGDFMREYLNEPFIGMISVKGTQVRTLRPRQVKPNLGRRAGLLSSGRWGVRYGTAHHVAHLESAIRVLAENQLLGERNFHILYSSCYAESRSFAVPVLAHYIHKNATGPILIPYPFQELTWRRDLLVRSTVEESGSQYLPFEQRVDKVFWRGVVGMTWWDCESASVEKCAMLMERFLPTEIMSDHEYKYAYARALRVNVRSMHFNWLLLRGQIESWGAPPFCREVPTEQIGPRSRLVSLSAEHPHMIDAKSTNTKMHGKFEHLQMSKGEASNADMVGHRYLAVIDAEVQSTNSHWVLAAGSVPVWVQTGFRTWTLGGMLKPFEHYLPVRTDLADLVDVISWAQSNPTASARMAERTRSLSFDFDTAGAFHYLQSVLLESLKVHPQTFDEHVWEKSGPPYDTGLLFLPKDDHNELIDYPWWETLPTELRQKVAELLDAGLLEHMRSDFNDFLSGPPLASD